MIRTIWRDLGCNNVETKSCSRTRTAHTGKSGWLYFHHTAEVVRTIRLDQEIAILYYILNMPIFQNASSSFMSGNLFIVFIRVSFSVATVRAASLWMNEYTFIIVNVNDSFKEIYVAYLLLHLQTIYSFLWGYRERRKHKFMICTAI